MAATTKDSAASADGLHLPRGAAERRMLETAKQLDVGFDLESPGLIILVAATGVWSEAGSVLPRPRDDDHAPHKLELFAPGGTTPVAARSTDAPESTLLLDVPEIGFTPGRWTARVTNLASIPQDFGITVSYPSRHALQFADLAADAFANLGDVHLEFQRGHQASSVRVETPAGPITHYFTVEDIEYTCPWMPRVMAYLDDVRSSRVAVSVPADTTDPVLRYELGFEDEGLEISGTIPLNLTDMRLTIDLPVTVQHHTLSRSHAPVSIDYDETGVRVSFAFTPQFEGLIEWLPGFFPMWRRSIQRTVEDACRALLATPELKKLFADAIEARVLARLGQNANPVGVAANGGKLRFSYYTL